MAFVNVEVRRSGRAMPPLQEGQVSVGKSGLARFRTADLRLVGIEGEVALLCDISTQRIGLRKPRFPEDIGSVVCVGEVKSEGKPVPDKRMISLGPAIRQLGLLPAAVRGRAELMTKDGLLIISLADRD